MPAAWVWQPLLPGGGGGVSPSPQMQLSINSVEKLALCVCLQVFSLPLWAPVGQQAQAPMEALYVGQSMTGQAVSVKLVCKWRHPGTSLGAT